MIKNKGTTTFRNAKNGKFAEKERDYGMVACEAITRGRRTREDVDAQIDRLLIKHRRALDALAKL